MSRLNLNEWWRTKIEVGSCCVANSMHTFFSFGCSFVVSFFWIEKTLRTILIITDYYLTIVIFFLFSYKGVEVKEGLIFLVFPLSLLATAMEVYQLPLAIPFVPHSSLFSLFCVSLTLSERVEKLFGFAVRVVYV